MNYTQRKFIESWAQTLLLNYFQMVGSPITLPIPIFDIAEKYFLLKYDVEYFEGRMKKVKAILMPSKRWVLLNKKQSEQDLRYSLAHEIVHWIVEEAPIEYYMKNDAVNLKYIYSRFEATVRELGAEYFAAALLMPRALINKYRVQFKHDSESEKAIQTLTDLFDVSPKLLRIRLNRVHEDFPELEKIEQSIVCAHQQKPTIAPKLSSPQYHIIIPPKDIFDHRFIRKLQLKRGKTYLFINKDTPNIDVFMEIKYGYGFLFPQDNHRSFEKDFAKMPEVEFLNLKHYDKYYQKIDEQNNVSETNETDRAYTRDPDDDIPDKQLDIKSLDSYIKKEKPNYRSDAKRFIQSCRKEGKKVVIVTGCFDLISNAHVRFLKHAKSLGDILVVGVENDRRIRSFKGGIKPINTAPQRMEVLNAFRSVDYTFVINGHTTQDVVQFYTRLYKELKADILAISKGDPHTEDRKLEIESAGGQIEILEVNALPGGATTYMLRQLLEKSIFADIVFVKKQTVYEWEEKTVPFQLALPIEID